MTNEIIPQDCKEEKASCVKINCERRNRAVGAPNISLDSNDDLNQFNSSFELIQTIKRIDALFPLSQSVKHFVNIQKNRSLVRMKQEGGSVVKTRLRLTLDEITARARRDYGSCSTRLRLVISLLLMLILGGGSAWAETHPYAGIWYMRIKKSSTHYMVPAADPQQASKEDAYFSGDSEKPFITTYATGEVLNAIWIFEPVEGEDNYYYIIHALTGKYIKYQTYLSGGNARRKYVHLETLDTPGETEKFEITTESTGVKIKPKGNSMYFNVAGDCQNSYNGGTSSPFYSGIIGGMTGTDDNSIFLLTNASAATTLTPTISDVDEATNIFSITSVAKAFTSFRYTTDGTTTPTANEGTLTDGVSVTPTAVWQLQVVGVRGNFITPVAIKEITPVVSAPIIAYNNATGEVTITTATKGATIYYTTDGTTNPTSSSEEYTSSFTISEPTTIKAVAIKNGVSSTNATLAIGKVATPTIQNNGSNAISITSGTGGATIYYTTDGSNPTTGSTPYTEPLTENVSNVTIKAIAVKEGMINSEVGSGKVKLQCATPIITRAGLTFSISCSLPTDAAIYYSLDGSEPATLYTAPVPFTLGQLPMTVKAVAKHADYTDSEQASFELKTGAGTADDPYLLYSTTDFANFISSVEAGTTSSAYYKLEVDISASGTEAITTPFSGTFDGGLHTISGLDHALFSSVDGGTVRNVILSDVTISSGTNVGAIANEAKGDSRIYNCGVLSGTVSGSSNVGSIVGLLDGTSRVINCYSYATVSGGSMMGGIVGRNNQTSKMNALKTIVVNCMFYGEITGATPGNAFPVYGGNLIDNAGTNAINNYNYFRSEAEFDNAYNNISNYNRSWPAEEKYLTRFEYYRNILNSNRHLCTFWITDKPGTDQTAADTALVAKWVLDPSIAPYPILKKWGKYPSVINPTPVNILGSLDVTVDPGSHNSTAASKTITLSITDMDEDNHDYGYYKVQLPYYNELFGDPNSDDHATRYGNNYTDMVVTGWDIISVTGGTEISDKAGTDADGVAYDHRFTANWESGYNFADRYCTEKDLFSESGRVFAQGGYYYVPEGVTAISIQAHWGTAVYVRNKDNSVDRINVTSAVGSGTEFTPAGKLPDTFQGQTVFTNIQDAIKSSSFSNLGAGKTVYDQAVVLVGNVQVRNGSNVVNYSGNDARPYTLMSADFDLDNEPDFCLQLQFRNDLERPRVQPVRFDFLSVPELGLAIRPDNKAWAIGIMVPAGHFEITETACMHTTQFEYDGVVSRVESPLILNGGHFEQIVVRYGSTSKGNGNADRTSYFIMGGRFWMKRFTPGNHANTGNNAKVRHCAVNVIGGEFPEFYLSGIYRPLSETYNDNPHCYINGGKFGLIAGAGTEQIKGNITFKIDHAIIDEFYGGGINASLPVLGSIDVTIDHSRVGKYCGGPKVGILGTTSDYKTVTTHATGSTFREYYGGGNGGTSYYREQKQDGDAAFPAQSADGWKNYGYSAFNPLNTVTGVTQTHDESATNKGYHGEYEFEVFNNSNGTTDKAVVRAYIQWVQFGTTATGTVTNYLKDCTVNGNFYGGGNLGNVNGNVISTLTGETRVTGSAFAAGFSAAIPSFRIHDKENATEDNFPARDFAGVITDHTLDYKKDAAGNDIYYTWTNTPQEGTTGDNRWKNATYEKDGKWYCWTWTSLENLGAVSGNATLTIKGNSTIGTDGDTTTGNVFGGGDESGVNSNTRVTVTDQARVLRSVYGGGNVGSVGDFNYAVGKPYELKNDTTGTCTVIIEGDAEIGPNSMSMKATGGPVDAGYVFGAGRGTVDPYYDDATKTDAAKQAAIAELLTGDATKQEELEKLLGVLETLAYVNKTAVTIRGNALVKGAVYGGSESGHVLGNTNVTIESGQIGCGKGTNARYDWSSTTTLDPCDTWDYELNGAPYDPFANNEGKYANDGSAEGGLPVAKDGHTFYGNVFGGGSGYYPYAPGRWLSSAGRVEGHTTVTINGGHILTNVYGGCEMADVIGSSTVTMAGGTVGVPRDSAAIAGLPTIGHIYGAGKGDKRIFFNKSTNVQSTAVTVRGGTVYGSVYGGGEDGHVMADAVTIVKDSASVSGEGDDAVTTTISPTIGCDGKSGYDGNVFGGGQGSPTALTAGVVSGNVTLRIMGGQMSGSVYGGGRIASVGTNFEFPKITDPEDSSKEIDNPAYGRMIAGDAHGNIRVLLTGGTIAQNVYGGCMGTKADSRIEVTEDFAAKLGLSKNVTVSLNGMAAADYQADLYGTGVLVRESETGPWRVSDSRKGCVVMQDIFGCNNVNSSPEGSAVVHVYATQNKDATQIAGEVSGEGVIQPKRTGQWDVQHVYGGGNLAAYLPNGPAATTTDNDGQNTTVSTTVIIDGCSRTSIRQVYGGGNAASTPATNVTVNGTYEIEEVFGGGNGKDRLPDGNDNPGANVGFLDYSAEESTYDTKEKRTTNPDFLQKYVYGTGEANVTISGGTIHRVFGGSNTKGNVRQTAVTMLEDQSDCDFCVDEAYGGGKSAPMDAEARLLMACIPGLKAVYGGAQAADIQGNVTLNITNGTFERVFGGNNISGTIRGSITVNVEETGCKPIIIGQLYGGGNQAGYSVYGYKEVTETVGGQSVTRWAPRESEDDEGEGPETPYADPQVNVRSFTSIGDVFGGGLGSTAVMVGHPTVNINVVAGRYKDYNGDSSRYEEADYEYNAEGFKGTVMTLSDGTQLVVPAHKTGTIGAVNNVYGGGNAAKVIGNTTVNIGTASDAGADIRGNVYGGGNDAEVTGNTNVNIGRKDTDTATSPEPSAP